MAQPPHDPAVTLTGQPRRRARRAVPITPEMLEGAPDFAPAPRGATRYDGWTPDRQRAFVKALAETGCVTRACAWVGMSNVGAYLLRKGDGAEGFARAWDDALAVGTERLADIAYERAVYGVPVPVFHKGEQVGEKPWHNDRLLMWVMRHSDRERYDDAPKDNRVPPHIRRAQRAEWEREKAEEDRRRKAEQDEADERAGEDLMEALRVVRSRMTGPPGEGSSLASVAAWALYGGDEEETPAPPGPRPPTPAERRAKVEAAWAARRRRQDLAEHADIRATGDPRDAEAHAAAHWQAMTDAGLIGSDDVGDKGGG